MLAAQGGEVKRPGFSDGKKLPIDIVFFFATFYLMINKSAVPFVIAQCRSAEYNWAGKEKNVCKEKMNIK